jgi:hypothetical protein
VVTVWVPTEVEKLALLIETAAPAARFWLDEVTYGVASVADDPPR